MTSDVTSDDNRFFWRLFPATTFLARTAALRAAASAASSAAAACLADGLRCAAPLALAPASVVFGFGMIGVGVGVRVTVSTEGRIVMVCDIRTCLLQLKLAVKTHFPLRAYLFIFHLVIVLQINHH